MRYGILLASGHGISCVTPHAFTLLSCNGWYGGRVGSTQPCCLKTNSGQENKKYFTH